MKKIILLLSFIGLAFAGTAQTSTYQLFSVTPFTQIENIEGEWRMTVPISLQYNIIQSFGEQSQYFAGLGAGGGLSLNADGNGKVDLNFPIGAYIGGQPLPDFPAIAFGGGLNLHTMNPILMINLNFTSTQIINTIKGSAPRYRQILKPNGDYAKTEIGFKVE